MTETTHLQWHAEALWQQLEPLLPGLTVEVLARTESTNSVLLERARQAPGPRARRADDTEPCLLVAEHQTRGRGRLGKQWQSAPGASLTFSLSLPFEPRDWAGLSLTVGVALADALDPLTEGATPRIGLKWPNDLWLVDAPVVGRKLGGILIETVAVGRRRMAVIGIGLNLQPQPVRDLASGFGSLGELDPQQAHAPTVLHRVALPLVQALKRHEQEGFKAFAEAFARRDILCGRAVLTTAAGLPGGIARGVAADGSLRVEDAAGTLHTISSGEVSVRLPDAAAAAVPPSQS